MLRAPAANVTCCIPGSLVSKRKCHCCFPKPRTISGTPNCKLVGGFNPSQKYASKWVHLPQIGVKIFLKKGLSCHHRKHLKLISTPFNWNKFHIHPQLPKLPTTEVRTLILPLDKVNSNSPLLEHETSSGDWEPLKTPHLSNRSYVAMIRCHDKIDDL